MGYTHYWYLNQKGDEEKYQRALKDIRKIIHVRRTSLADGMGEGKPVYEKEISINGKGDQSHETFFLPPDLANSQVHVSGIGQEGNFCFNFCKTAYKPYDEIVTACLSILFMHLGKDVRVSSDGDASDWERGIKFAEMVLCVKVPNPLDRDKFIE